MNVLSDIQINLSVVISSVAAVFASLGYMHSRFLSKDEFEIHSKKTDDVYKELMSRLEKFDDKLDKLHEKILSK